MSWDDCHGCGTTVAEEGVEGGSNASEVGFCDAEGGSGEGYLFLLVGSQLLINEGVCLKMGKQGVFFGKEGKRAC